MNLIVSTAPESPTEWPAWLEQQIVGLDLGRLVEELKITATQTDSLAAILSQSQIEEIRGQGLAGLSIELLRSLMNSPESLLELQEQVLVEGGPYWRSVRRTAEHEAFIQQSAARVIEHVREKGTVVPQGSVDWGAFLKWGLAIAAVMLVAFFLAPRNEPPAPAPGGSELVAEQIIVLPEGFTKGEPDPDRFYRAFAEASHGWYSKTPEDIDQLIEFGEILSAEFDQFISQNPLPDKHREWFVQKCKVWQGKVNGIVIQLSDGNLEFRTGREQLDDTVMGMIEILRQGPSQAELEAA